MAGAACFSGRVAAHQVSRDPFTDVLIRQQQRPRHLAKAAPCQRPKGTIERKHSTSVTRAAVAIPELGVSVTCCGGLCVYRGAPTRLLSVTSSTVLAVKCSSTVAMWLYIWGPYLYFATASTLFATVQGPLKVDDVMTKKTLFSVREDTSIDEGVHSQDLQLKLVKWHSILTSKHARSAATGQVAPRVHARAHQLAYRACLGAYHIHSQCATTGSTWQVPNMWFVQRWKASSVYCGPGFWCAASP